MASAFGHAAAAIALASALRTGRPPRRYWLLAIGCAVAPDLDVLGFGLGIPYGSLLGHRGLSHSLAAAAVIAALALLLVPRALWPERRARLWLAFALATASHGLLDAMTDGGLGVAFFSPVDATRHVLPWRPILVSPVDPEAFFSDRGLAILRSEATWIGLASLALLVLSEGSRAVLRRRRDRAVPAAPA